MIGRCADCAFWERRAVNGCGIPARIDEPSGFCHRYPPVNAIDLAETDEEWWCGEFKSKPCMNFTEGT